MIRSTSFLSSFMFVATAAITAGPEPAEQAPIPADPKPASETKKEKRSRKSSCKKKSPPAARAIRRPLAALSGTPRR